MMLGNRKRWSSSASARTSLSLPNDRPGRDLAPIPQPTLSLPSDRSGEARLVDDPAGSLMAHAEELGDLDDAK
jgi:hypothetical protein